MKKTIISLLMSFSILFYSFVPSIAYADVGTATAGMIAGSAQLLPEMGPLAPYVAVVAVACISAGIIFDNREEIVTVAGGIYQNLKKAGLDVTTGASGSLSLGASALANIKAQISDLYSTQKINFTMPVGDNVMQLGSIVMLSGMVIPEGSYITYTEISWQGPKTFFFGTGCSWLVKSIDSTSVTFQYTDPSQSMEQTLPMPQTGAITFPTSIPTQNVCADIPSAMTGTPTVTAPYPVDTALDVPADSTFNPSATATGTATQTWEDSLVGETDWTIPFDTSIPTDVPIDTTGTGVLAPTDYGMPTTGTLNFAPLMNLGLTHKFPFSIPWDIKQSFEGMVTAPTAPTFDIDMTHWLGGSHYVINFNKFDKWASIIRWGLLVIFNIGLIIKTRDIIRG